MLIIITATAIYEARINKCNFNLITHLLPPVLLSFLKRQDQYDSIITPQDGQIRVRGSNVFFVDKAGAEHKTITMINSVLSMVSRGLIKEVQ